MARIASIASLVIIGVIIADLVTHASGVTQATNAVSSGVVRPSLNALLGATS